jgi:hypothetical protein
MPSELQNPLPQNFKIPSLRTLKSPRAFARNETMPTHTDFVGPITVVANGSVDKISNQFIT